MNLKVLYYFFPPKSQLVKNSKRSSLICSLSFASLIFYSFDITHNNFGGVTSTSSLWEQTGGRIMLLASERIAQVVCLRAAPYLPTSPKFPRDHHAAAAISSMQTRTPALLCCKLLFGPLRDQRQPECNSSWKGQIQGKHYLLCENESTRVIEAEIENHLAIRYIPNHDDDILTESRQTKKQSKNYE